MILMQEMVKMLIKTRMTIDNNFMFYPFKHETKANNELVEFLGWERIYAKFRIRRGLLPNGRSMCRIIVAHEGDWINPEAMWGREYESYEDVQKHLGRGLTFMAKEYSAMMGRSLFSYSLDCCEDIILAVPATGEEIYFEIYGADEHHGLNLLVEREL